ncbi:MAG: hypothetical protein GIX03_10200 [Candidatus Eremiobacteraeota bacterium]|nr:hypothetical protein [Candidatus Eremiobacteraeota bacterium]
MPQTQRRLHDDLAFDEFDPLVGADDPDFPHSFVFLDRNGPALIIDRHITHLSIASWCDGAVSEELRIF